MEEASKNTTEEEIIRPAQATFTCTGTRLFADVAEITLTPIPYHDEHNERFFITYPSAKITLGNVRNARDLFRLGEDYRVVFEPVTQPSSDKAAALDKVDKAIASFGENEDIVGEIISILKPIYNSKRNK